MKSNCEENDSPLPKPWKILVPRCDKRLVLSAIENQLSVTSNELKPDRCKSKGMRKNDSSQRLDGSNNMAIGNTDNLDPAGCSEEDDQIQIEKDKFFLSCIEKTAASLSAQVDSLTVSVDEKEIEQGLESFQSQLCFCRQGSPPIDCDESFSSTDEEEEIDFEDEELLDQEAYEKLKVLRNQARDVASRVFSLREKVVERAMGVTKRNVSELLQVHGFPSLDNADDSSIGESEEKGDNKKSPNKDSHLVDPMRAALRCLSSSLEKIDSDLVQKVDSLRDTIGTIDSSISRYQRISQGDEYILSQTERALLSNSYEEQGMPEVEEESESETTEEIVASDNLDGKLAFMLAGAL